MAKASVKNSTNKGSTVKRTPALTSAQRSKKRREKVKAEKTETDNLDVRKTLFLSYYFSPESDTFSNVLQSALKAGFSKDYSETLTYQRPDWFTESIGKFRNSMLEKAELELNKMLNLDVEQPMFIIDTQGLQVIRSDEKKVDPSLVKIKQDTLKFVTETLGKAIYSKRQEHTGEGGGAILFQPISYADSETTDGN